MLSNLVCYPFDYALCYPFDYARTCLASDVGTGKKSFDGIGNCILKTIKHGDVTGIYRGGQLCLFGQIRDMNPYKSDKGMIGIVSALTCATVARTATTTFNYPFDTHDA